MVSVHRKSPSAFGPSCVSTSVPDTAGRKPEAVAHNISPRTSPWKMPNPSRKWHIFSRGLIIGRRKAKNHNGRPAPSPFAPTATSLAWAGRPRAWRGPLGRLGAEAGGISACRLPRDASVRRMRYYFVAVSVVAVVIVQLLL